MSFSIIWSPVARGEYAAVLEYLDKTYGTEAALNLLDQTEKVIEQIATFPEMYPASRKQDIRKALISKQSSLIYRPKEDRIEILHFWDNRKDPDSLDEMLE